MGSRARFLASGCGAVVRGGVQSGCVGIARRLWLCGGSSAGGRWLEVGVIGADFGKFPAGSTQTTRTPTIQRFISSFPVVRLGPGG